MKCEICNSRDAETAINLEKDGTDSELYVCAECARKEKVRRQKKSQFTRRSAELPGVSISVTRVDGNGGSPPLIEALMNAVSGIVDNLESAVKSKTSAGKSSGKPRVFPCARVDSRYRMGGALHLEGLHLIGEMPAVMRAMRALKMNLAAKEADGIADAGHVYAMEYEGSSEVAKRVVADILEQECNARVRLRDEMPRVFSDAVCRALALLKNCRLLAPGELFDLLSPLRLAALEGFLDGIDMDGIESLIASINLSPRGDNVSVEERDAADAAMADDISKRFEDVVLSEAAEEKFL